jgi:hypothetical protein
MRVEEARTVQLGIAAAVSLSNRCADGANLFGNSGLLWREVGGNLALQLRGAAGRFWSILREQIADAQVSGPLVTDAALAALALEHAATLCSNDRDFRRFRGLKLLDPLQEARPP